MSRILTALGIVVMVGALAAPAMAAGRGGQHSGMFPRSSRVFVTPRVVTVPRVVVRPFGYYGTDFGYYGYYGGYYGPGWFYGPAYPVENLGEVKFDTKLKDASVYVDGGYVGPIGKFKKFRLKPGDHDIELRDSSGRGIFNQRVQVIVNKSIELRPTS